VRFVRYFLYRAFSAIPGIKSDIVIWKGHGRRKPGQNGNKIGSSNEDDQCEDGMADAAVIT
jgi:hypothetical protein